MLLPCTCSSALSCYDSLTLLPQSDRGSNVDDQTKNKSIIDELIKSYFMELETVVNYLANRVNLDGVRAEEIKKNH